MVRPETPKGVVLVLMPIGRDAATVAKLIERAGLRPVVCNTLQEVIENLEWVIEVVVVAEEALYGNNARVLEDWVGRQPPWSDQPFVVLTNRNEGGKFAAFRRELVIRLRNVGFLERPFRPSRFRPRYFPQSALEDDSIKLVRTLRRSAAPLPNWSVWLRRERLTLSGRTVNSGKKLRVASGPRQRCCRHRKSRRWANLSAGSRTISITCLWLSSATSTCFRKN